MARIIALRPDTTLVFSLDGPFTQLAYAPSSWGKTPCLGIVGRFCPNPLGIMTHQGSIQDLMYLSELSLVRIPMSFSDVQGGTGALGRITAALNDMVSEENDIVRMREAFQLFKNGKVNEELLNKAIEQSVDLVSVYYQIREWAASGFEEKKTIDVNVAKTRLVLLP